MLGVVRRVPVGMHCCVCVKMKRKRGGCLFFVSRESASKHVDKFLFFFAFFFSFFLLCTVKKKQMSVVAVLQEINEC